MEWGVVENEIEARGVEDSFECVQAKFQSGSEAEVRAGKSAQEMRQKRVRANLHSEGETENPSRYATDPIKV
jgi:hypothetical protein